MSKNHQRSYHDAQQTSEARWFIILGTNLCGFLKLVGGRGWQASTPRGLQMLLSKGLLHPHHPWGRKSYPLVCPVHSQHAHVNTYLTDVWPPMQG